MKDKNIILVKNSDGKRSVHEYTYHVFCENRGLIELVVKGEANSVYCDGNQLTKIEIPSSVKTLWCNNNNFTELNMPDTLQILICDKELFDYDECKISDVSIVYDGRLNE